MYILSSIPSCSHEPFLATPVRNIAKQPKTEINIQRKKNKFNKAIAAKPKSVVAIIPPLPARKFSQRVDVSANWKALSAVIYIIMRLFTVHVILD